MTTLLLYVFSGIALTGGLTALVVFFRGSDQEQVPDGPSRAVRWAAGHRVELAVSVVGGALAWLLTGVVLGAVLVPALVFGVPWLVAATRPDTRRVEKLEALAEWTQRLADVLLLGVGLEQAITGSLRTAPARLEREIADLVGRLQARWTPADALRAFGDELRDATADKLIAALLLRAADRGPGLARALTDLAESVREEVRQRRTIEADRAKHRATVRWMVLIILAVVLAGVLNPGYTAPYRTPSGELVLAVAASAFVGIVWWMRKLASHQPVPRFLEPDRRSRTGKAVEPETDAEGAEK